MSTKYSTQLKYLTESKAQAKLVKNELIASTRFIAGKISLLDYLALLSSIPDINPIEIDETENEPDTPSSSQSSSSQPSSSQPSSSQPSPFQSSEPYHIDDDHFDTTLTSALLNQFLDEANAMRVTSNNTTHEPGDNTTREQASDHTPREPGDYTTREQASDHTTPSDHTTREPGDNTTREQASDHTPHEPSTSLACEPAAKPLLSWTQISGYLGRFACKSDFVLPVEKATSLTTEGTCSIGPRKLSNCRFVYGAVSRSNQWLVVFIDIDERDFVFIDPCGASESDLRHAFLNWLKFVNTRKDLTALDAQRQFKQRVIEHPRLIDSFNCGVFVCKLLSMLIQEEPIHSDSFDASTIDHLRVEICGA